MDINFREPFDGVEWEEADKADAMNAIQLDLYYHGRSITCTDTINIETRNGKHVSGTHNWDTDVWTLYIGHGREQFGDLMPYDLPHCNRNIRGESK